MEARSSGDFVRRGILILEDDPDVAQIMITSLKRDGWITHHAATLSDGFEAMRANDPCIIIVDLELPDGNGMYLVREAAGRPRTGVIVLSGRTDEVDRVIGLEIGADDYVSKPFSPREVTARVRSLHRRLGGDAEMDRPSINAAPAQQMPTPREQRPIQINDVLLDPARMRVSGPDGAFVNLTGGEADLLSRLIRAGEVPVGRHEVAEQVLGHKLLPQQRGIDQLASNLRRKLESVAGNSVRITAVRGKGYRLVF